MKSAAATRTGGGLVADSLVALGADAAFGLPGIHALPIWDALADTAVRVLPLRTELDAGFAADGFARVTGRPVPLLLSTGPGALNALTALMESASSHVPVVAIASQIPSEFLGRHRGQLHELPDQLASFAPVVKTTARARSAEEIPEALAAAWRTAQEPPAGPAFLEVPADVLAAPAEAIEPGALDGSPRPADAPEGDLAAAAALLGAAQRPVLWAGGGVIRAGAWDQLRVLAEQLDAPVVTTFMGKGSLPHDHPLAVGSACNEPAVLRLLATADVVLCVGSRLGADTTGDYALRFEGRLIHLDADPRCLGATYDALPLLGDAGATLRALRGRLPTRAPGSGGPRAQAVREQVAERLAREEPGPEPGLVRALRAALPTDAVDAWDSTILGYWGASYFEARLPRRFLYPLGSGTIGYAWPAALGAAAALPDVPVLCVCGDGGIQYGLAELAAAREQQCDVALVLVDDGGYGILREYQAERFGRRTATDLLQPDFAAVCRGFDVAVRRSSLGTFGADVEWALEQSGPAVVLLQEELSCYRMA